MSASLAFVIVSWHNFLMYLSNGRSLRWLGKKQGARVGQEYPGPDKKRKAKRLMGLGAGLIFKGTGFYETDYKRAGSKQNEGGAESSSSDSSSSESKGTEKKSTGSDSKPKKESSSKKEKSST